MATKTLTASLAVASTDEPKTSIAGTTRPATARSSEDAWTLAARGLKVMLLWRMPPAANDRPRTSSSCIGRTGRRLIGLRNGHLHSSSRGLAAGASAVASGLCPGWPGAGENDLRATPLYEIDAEYMVAAMTKATARWSGNKVLFNI